MCTVGGASAESSRASNENARSSPPFARDASLLFECLCASHASPRRATVCRDASTRVSLRSRVPVAHHLGVSPALVRVALGRGLMLAELLRRARVVDAARGGSGVALLGRLEHPLPPRLVRAGLLHRVLLGPAAPHRAPTGDSRAPETRARATTKASRPGPRARRTNEGRVGERRSAARALLLRGNLACRRKAAPPLN
jgi:hypothetical protein